MSRPSLVDRSLQLRTSRIPFVRARVVLAERPTSARPGDEALILADGTIEGFVGGSCAESTVREQSLALLGSGQTRLVRITPAPEDEQPGKVTVHNPCLSGGTMEIFLAPEVPAPLLVVVGGAPIAQALVDLGGELGYEARVYTGGDLPDDTSSVVVASHGQDNEAAILEAALRADIAYIGLVASPKRGSAIVAGLDVDDELRARVNTPAGLDIGARTPAEVALSILAEIIAQRPRTAWSGGPPEGAPDPHASPDGDNARHGARDDAGQVRGDAAGSPLETSIDPVCGMSVAMVEASLHVEHDGEVVWFCGPGCVQAFAADPASFTT